MFQSIIKHQSDVNDVVLVSLLLTLNIFLSFLIVDFEHIFGCVNMLAIIATS